MGIGFWVLTAFSVGLMIVALYMRWDVKYESASNTISEEKAVENLDSAFWWMFAGWLVLFCDMFILTLFFFKHK